MSFLFFRLEIKLVPLSEKDEIQILNWNATMFQGDISEPQSATGLRLNHNYEPKIRVFYTVSGKTIGYSGNTSTHLVECSGDIVSISIWKCKTDNASIPWNAICNGTENGKTGN